MHPPHGVISSLSRLNPSIETTTVFNHKPSVVGGDMNITEKCNIADVCIEYWLTPKLNTIASIGISYLLPLVMKSLSCVTLEAYGSMNRKEIGYLRYFVHLLYNHVLGYNDCLGSFTLNTGNMAFVTYRTIRFLGGLSKTIYFKEFDKVECMRMQLLNLKGSTVINHKYNASDTHILLVITHDKYDKLCILCQTNSGMLTPDTEIYKAYCVNFRLTTCVL